MRSTCDHPLLTHRRFGLTGPPVYVDFGVNSGRLGNRLFQAAAALVLANRSGSPVSFASQVADDQGVPVCANSERAQTTRRHLQESGPPHAGRPYHLSIWGAGGPHALRRRDGNLTEYGQRRQRCGSVDAAQQAQCGLATTHWWPLFRRAFATPQLDASMQGIKLPERNALVFHFRDLSDCKGSGALEGRGSAGQRAPAAVAKRAHGDDLRDGSDGKLPPSSFFDAAIALHRQRWPTGRVWIVCQPCERHNPVVQRILHRWPNASTLRLRNGSALQDFAWVRAARHIGIAPSTFGWWAGYLSEARTINYPALPSSQMPCVPHHRHHAQRRPALPLRARKAASQQWRRQFKARGARRHGRRATRAPRVLGRPTCLPKRRLEVEQNEPEWARVYSKDSARRKTAWCEFRWQ